MNSAPELQAVLPSPVLIVEDEPLLQQRLHGILLQLGYGPDALLHAASLRLRRLWRADGKGKARAVRGGDHES